MSDKEIIKLENNSELKFCFELIPKLFKKYWDKKIEQDTISTSSFGWQIEAEDQVYQIETNITVRDKHTCDECIYYDNKCLKDEDISSVDKKIYCENFNDEKRCWDCKHYQAYNCDEYLCDCPDLNFNDSFEFLYKDDWNAKEKCPHFKVKI